MESVCYYFTLADLKVEKHPDKTFIGRISPGFDFLGYSFSPSGLGIATRTIQNFRERITRLYERGADDVRIGEYARRWWQWVRAGVSLMDLVLESACFHTNYWAKRHFQWRLGFVIGGDVDISP